MATIKSILKLLALFLAAGSALAQTTITNVSAVNVTPSGFTVVGAVFPHISSTTNFSIAVFADPAGATNLAGQVGVEYYPIHTGIATLTNAYTRLIGRIALRQQTMNQGMLSARISYCAPATTYYYRLTVTGGNGQVTNWPASGPLPSVTTALENSFVLQSLQLIVTLKATSPAGAIITLANTNTTSMLAAVVGDGASTNQAVFNLSDLLDPTGATNFAPLGSQNFTATLLGSSGHGLSQGFSLTYSTNFIVAQPNSISVGQLFSTLTFAYDVLQPGSSGLVPISIKSGAPLANVSFVLNVPTATFSEFSIEATTPLLDAIDVQVIDPSTLHINFTAQPGHNFLGNQQVAQLNFIVASNQPSAFVPLWPQGLQGTNADGGPGNFLVQPGRLVIVGEQSLLDSAFDTNGNRNLILYATPERSYQIQASGNLGDANAWSDVVRVPVTNLTTVVPDLGPTPPSVFYRAYQFSTVQPIVDVLRTPIDGLEGLVLYGTPGLAYEIDYATSITSPWTLLRRVPMTNFFDLTSGLSATNQAAFYRFSLLNADPPILEASLTGTNRSVLAYGLSGTNYALQYTTNLAGTVAWHPQASFTLSNSFQWFTNLGNSSPAIFYRLQKP